MNQYIQLNTLFVVVASESVDVFIRYSSSPEQWR
jgi:hypothetical protein